MTAERSYRIGTQDMRRCSGVQVPYGLGKGAGSEGKGFPARVGPKEAKSHRCETTNRNWI